jgi:hypothetical protein
MKNSAHSLVVGIVFVIVTAGLLFLVGEAKMLSGIGQVLMIIAGMTAVAALTAFQRFIESDGIQTPLVQMSFNEVFVSESISEGAAKPEMEESTGPKVLPWDLSLGQLVGADNSLALARLRIEIERELRRIAYNNKIDVGVRPLSVIGLAQELVSKEVLPAPWLGALKEIIPVCNQAIHGSEVPDGVAASVVRVGGQLLERLRRVTERVVFPSGAR